MARTLAQKTTPPNPPLERGGESRRGFTMVELLIVITVIAILIGLLVPAVSGVQRRVRHAAVQSEIGRLASSITAFKTQFGVEPPSSIVLCENQAHWTTPPLPFTAQDVGRSRALIRQIWPQFNFNAPHDFNGDNDTTDAPVNVEPGECLVYFLGGMPVPNTATTPPSFSLLGFTKNPQDPFSRAANANREKSAYDFPASRLVDSDTDGFPEFLDSYPGQRSPVLYFSSYDGNGYRGAEYPATGSFPAAPYLQNPGKLEIDGTTGTPPDVNYYVVSITSGNPFNSKSFQLISPGPDGEYGPGGPYLTQSSTGTNPLPAWSLTKTAPDPDINSTARMVERDNITNFGNGPLVP